MGQNIRLRMKIKVLLQFSYKKFRVFIFLMKFCIRILERLMDGLPCLLKKILNVYLNCLIPPHSKLRV